MGQGEDKGVARVLTSYLGREKQNDTPLEANAKHQVNGKDKYSKIDIPEAQGLKRPGWLSEVVVPNLGCTGAQRDLNPVPMPEPHFI